MRGHGMVVKKNRNKCETSQLPRQHRFSRQPVVLESVMSQEIAPERHSGAGLETGTAEDGQRNPSHFRIVPQKGDFDLERCIESRIGATTASAEG